MSSTSAPVCDKISPPKEKIDVKYNPAEGKAEQKRINESYDKRMKQDTNKTNKWSSQKSTPLFQP